MTTRVALVQQSASFDERDNLERGIEAVKEAAGAGARIVAFAELAFQRFHPQVPAGPDILSKAETIPGPTTEIFQRLAGELGVVVVLNLFERQGTDTYDASPVIDADGRLLGTTRMVHIMEGPCFHERGYYRPGDGRDIVFETRAGKIGVAICYDRHFPEYMRALRIRGAELVLIPQAGAVGEWPEGLFEAEVRVAAFQNGYFCGLVNRVGPEEKLTFAGESFMADPDGRILARAAAGRDEILYADCDLEETRRCHAARHFWPDRRPDLYRTFNGGE